MSWPALTWAKSITVGSSSQKAVLMALAYRHNEDLACAYPSIASISEFTELDRKTIIAALNALKEKGLIEDTGERHGKTKQVIAYSLNMSQNGYCSDFSGKQYQKRDTEKQLINNTPSELSTPTSESNLQTQRIDNSSVPVFEKIETACRKKLIPFDVVPDEYLEWAKTERLWTGDQAKLEGQRFVDKSKAKGYKNIDWFSAWRNWCRSPFCQTPMGVPKKPIRIDRWD